MKASSLKDLQQFQQKLVEQQKLAAASEAHALMESSTHIGKIVLKVGG